MLKIVYEEENQRAVAYDEGVFKGESTYSKTDKIWIIDHTYVEDSCTQTGVASQLVALLVEEARKHKMKVIPLCPFAKAEFERKPEYHDVLSGN